MVWIQIILILMAIFAGYFCAFGENLDRLILICVLVCFAVFYLPIAHTCLEAIPKDVFDYQTIAGKYGPSRYDYVFSSIHGAFLLALKILPIAAIFAPFSFIVTREGTRIYLMGKGRSVEKFRA